MSCPVSVIFSVFISREAAQVLSRGQSSYSRKQEDNRGCNKDCVYLTSMLYWLRVCWDCHAMSQSGMEEELVGAGYPFELSL